MRVLHCHLPDLPGARGRARQSAWADISYKRYAGERAPGRREDGQAYRPLPELPRLHDDLPFRRALHASRRPRAGVYRADLPPPAFRADAALDAGADPALSDALPGRATGRQDRPALRLSDAGCAAEGDAGHGPEADPAGQPQRRPAGLPGGGRAQDARGADDGLRAAGAEHRYQRCHDPTSDAAGLRCGDRRGAGLLRGADPSHGQDGRKPCHGGEEHPRLARAR